MWSSTHGVRETTMAPSITPLKTGMRMETQRFEDAFVIKHGDFPLSCWVFFCGCNLKHQCNETSLMTHILVMTGISLKTTSNFLLGNCGLWFLQLCLECCGRKKPNGGVLSYISSWQKKIKFHNSPYCTCWKRTRWWFQMFLEFSPLFGEDVHFDWYFWFCKGVETTNWDFLADFLGGFTWLLFFVDGYFFFGCCVVKLRGIRGILGQRAANRAWVRGPRVSLLRPLFGLVYAHKFDTCKLYTCVYIFI